MLKPLKPYVWLDDAESMIYFRINLLTNLKFDVAGPETAEDFANERFIIKYKVRIGTGGIIEQSINFRTIVNPVKFDFKRHSKITIQIYNSTNVLKGSTTIKPRQGLFF